MSITSLATGQISDFAIGVGIGSQLPGRFEGGPANVMRHLVLSAELTRNFGQGRAESLLNFHEWGESGADSAVDVRANQVGVAIGQWVRQNGGNYNDVVELSYQALEKSFGPWNYFEAAPGSRWNATADGMFVPPVNDIVIDGFGSQLSVSPLARRAG